MLRQLENIARMTAAGGGTPTDTARMMGLFTENLERILDLLENATVGMEAVNPWRGAANE